MLHTVPIWMSDWTFENKKKHRLKVTDVLVKGHNESEVINNELFINKARKGLGNWKKYESYKPIKINFKEQYGFGIDETY